MSTKTRTMTIRMSAYERAVIVVANLAGRSRDEAERFALAADLAVNLALADPKMDATAAARAALTQHYPETRDADVLVPLIADLAEEKRSEQEN